MPSQLFNFTKYFKKDESKSASDAPQTTTTQSFQGAGSPVQGQAYSGIGNPSGGQSYSGIGNPPPPNPAGQTPVSTTTTVVNQSASAPNTPVSTDQPNNQPASPAGGPAPPIPTKSGEGGSSIDMGKRVGMDVLSRLTQRANTVLMKSVAKVKELKVQYIDTEHVLWGLLQDSSIYQLISDCKVVPSEIQASLEKSFKKGNFAGSPQFGPRVKRVLELALSAARSLGYEFISPEHILLALSQEGEGVAAQVLTKSHLTREVLNQKITGKKEIEQKKEDKKGSALEQYTEDLTAKAARGELDPVVGRSWEIERIIHILSRRTKNNPVLIGDAGVGKTAIVEGMAERISKGDVPETLLHKKILSLDLMSLIAGAGHRGEFEERLKNLIKEVKAAAGGIILFIDEIHNMVGAGSGSEGTMDASNILKPSLARGELQVIGTTTITEFRKYIEKDPALERRFQQVLVSEPTADIAIEMVTALRDKYEAFHRVKIPDEAVEAAVKLSQKYIADRFLPDKAVDLIDEAAAAVRLPAISLPEEIKSNEIKLKKLAHEVEEATKMGDAVRVDSLKKEIEESQTGLEKLKEQYQIKKSTTTNTVNPETIAEIVSRWTNIPVSRLTEDEALKLLDLEKIIHKRLINQEEAVSAIAEAVRRGRAGLKSNKRPIGSFIFMGPTGVGKTELAKSLAEILFGSEEMMVRLDMTEYMEKHEVAKLIGAPPGYVGYEEGGQLTEAVRRRPYAVVLLDEIEKAHPDVFNILIQVLDDGRLTDNKGRTISFKNTIVICTSNLGSGIIQEEMLGWSMEEIKKLKPLLEPQEILKTFSVSPSGREMITLHESFWKKEPQENIWKKGKLKDYFAGSIVTGMTLKEGEMLFPVDDIDTHAISPDGSETITFEDKVWFRTSTTAKEWKLSTILDGFKDYIVINAMPDKPEKQLPTAKFDTHAISLQNQEIITFASRFWKKENNQVKDWTTGTLSEYFANATLIKEQEIEKPGQENKDIKKSDNKDTAGLIQQREVKEIIEFPIDSWDIHLFKPTGEEIVVSKGAYYMKKDPNVANWIKGPLEKLFTVLEVEQSKEDKEEELKAKAKTSEKDDKSETTQSQPENQTPDNLKTENLMPDEKPIIPVNVESRTKTEDKKKKDDRFDTLATRLMEELRKFFRPELLNRYDEVIVFRPLTRDHMLEIVGLQMKMLKKILEEQNIAINVSPYAQAYLTEIGFDPIFGARPLRRTIQREIENPISSYLIKGDLKEGDTITIDYDGQALTFNIKKLAPLKPAAENQSTENQNPANLKPEIDTYKCQSCSNIFEVPTGSQNAVCPKCQSSTVILMPPPPAANALPADPSTVQTQPVAAPPAQPAVLPQQIQNENPVIPPSPPVTSVEAGTVPAPPAAPVNPQNPLESYYNTGSNQAQPSADSGQTPSTQTTQTG